MEKEVGRATTYELVMLDKPAVKKYEGAARKNQMEGAIRWKLG